MCRVYLSKFSLSLSLSLSLFSRVSFFNHSFSDFLFLRKHMNTNIVFLQFGARLARQFFSSLPPAKCNFKVEQPTGAVSGIRDQGMVAVL